MENQQQEPPTVAPLPVRMVAVIDIGTSAIRMAIAEINIENNIRILEHLSQALNLGQDTFTLGYIQRSTIEECVAVLQDYQRVLAEYQIDDPSQMRVVTTSAVREAENQLAFLDRIYIATDIEVEVIEEAEVSRITYLGIQPQLASTNRIAPTQLICEVGGGNTEVLLVQEKSVTFSKTYPLGSLRLRQTLKASGTPTKKLRNMMENRIGHIVDQVGKHVPKEDSLDIVAIGGDVRLVAKQILPQWTGHSIESVPVEALAQLTNDILEMPVDEVARNYKIRDADAQTLAPALLTYVRLARALDLQKIYVSNTNLRDGLLQEMAGQESWSQEFQKQIVGSVLELGRKFNFDEAHALQIAHLAQTLFREMVNEHKLDPRYETIIYLAALLHEIGLFIDARGYHKHTMYLIRNSELFGLGKTNLLLVALVARYHRRVSPQPKHEGYDQLDRHQRIVVSKLAAMLRVAVALDASRSQRISHLSCHRQPQNLVISTPDVTDLSMEQIALQEDAGLFEEVFGIPVRFSTNRSL